MAFYKDSKPSHPHLISHYQQPFLSSRKIRATTQWVVCLGLSPGSFFVQRQILFLFEPEPEPELEREIFPLMLTLFTVWQKMTFQQRFFSWGLFSLSEMAVFNFT
jgi:hypothetical protein